MLEKFINKNKIALGFFHQDLGEIIYEKDILKKYLEENQCDKNTIDSLCYFSKIKKGDIVAVKSTYVKAKNTGVMKVSAIGRALENPFDGYEYDTELVHTLPVEWISKDVKEFEGISYLKSIQPEDGIFKRISFEATYESLKEEYKNKESDYNSKKIAVINNINNNKASKKFVLIIDEINRGNISKIFGELITLLEEDKIIGADNTLVVTLPYTKEKFSLPNNLYIIGTMNIADKSISLIDIVLRRRFMFKELFPNSGLLQEIDNIDLEKLLYTINKRVEFLLDKNYMIGHAYFVNLTSIDDIMDVMKNKIIPLLEEYFYGDNEKIGMVLGGIDSNINSDFIVYKETVKGNDIFKNFQGVNDLGVREFFRIKEEFSEKEIRSIYE